MLNFIKSLLGIKKTFVEKVYIPEEKIDEFLSLYDIAHVSNSRNRELWKFLKEIIDDKLKEIRLKIKKETKIDFKIKVDPLNPYIEIIYEL